MTTAEFGLTGLAVMGQNLARNMGRHGVRMAVHNRTTIRTTDFMERYAEEGSFVGATTTEEFVAALERPRRIMMMVKAGDPVDALIAELSPFLEPGDILIDGGNSLFGDTRRRERELRERGLHFIGCGVSGGEEGALNGPSIMPGASPEAYAAVEGVLTRIAAQVDGTPCCTLVGSDGAGHYVKMVHNGIEYADMQLIAEAYDLLRTALGLSAPAIADIFEEWNRGELDSFLIEITSRVLRQVDATTGGPLVDVIVDQAEQKGTGRWTAQSALELGVPITGITEAVFARVVSSRRAERIAASSVLPGPRETAGGGSAEDALVEDVRRALYASKIVAYAQGFEQMAAAAAQYGWDIDLGA
ncbi:MAG: 6-phosphogluconate dehydrogenase, decarboxylating, partial [uncultured Thermoleophilia bacterium]